MGRGRWRTWLRCWQGGLGQCRCCWWPCPCECAAPLSGDRGDTWASDFHPCEGREGWGEGGGGGEEGEGGRRGEGENSGGRGRGGEGRGGEGGREGGKGRGGRGGEGRGGEERGGREGGREGGRGEEHNVGNRISLINIAR